LFDECALIPPEPQEAEQDPECTTHSDCTSDELYCTQYSRCEPSVYCCFAGYPAGGACPQSCPYSQQDYLHALVSTCCVHPAQNYSCAEHIPEPPNQPTAPNDTGGQETGEGTDVSSAATPSMQLVSLMTSWLWLKYIESN
jgi:hypothetical protein